MAAGNVMMRAQYTDLYIDRLPYLDEILFENLDAPSLTYTEVFNVRDSARAYEEITQITGFDPFPVKDESVNVTYDKLLQGYDTRFKHVTYAKGFQITMEAMEDDIDGAITNAAPALARVARNSIESEAFGDFNTGFSSTTAPDGVALFGTHLLVGGGTYSNLVTGDIAQATLESAINIFDSMKDDRNQLVEMAPSILLYPPELRWVVHELLKSQLRSDTANNAANSLNQIGLRTVMSKYLTDADSWFLLSEPNQHRLMFYWRMEPATDHTLDFDSGNMKTKMTFRFSHGPADWRGLVGGLGV